MRLSGALLFHHTEAPAALGPLPFRTRAEKLLIFLLYLCTSHPTLKVAKRCETLRIISPQVAIWLQRWQPIWNVHNQHGTLRMVPFKNLSKRCLENVVKRPLYVSFETFPNTLKETFQKLEKNKRCWTSHMKRICNVLPRNVAKRYLRNLRTTLYMSWYETLQNVVQLKRIWNFPK